MKFQIKYLVSAFLVLSLLAGWVTPAYAADGIFKIAPSTLELIREDKNQPLLHYLGNHLQY